MSELKFRAFDEEFNAMYSGEQIESEDNLDAWLSYGELVTYRIDDGVYVQLNTLQYTGLKDKNGNEIYEGDIVRIFVENDPEEKEYISKVYKLDGAFAVDMAGYDISTDVHCIGWIPEDYSLEVIGNIHSNPELLRN